MRVNSAPSSRRMQGHHFNNKGHKENQKYSNHHSIEYLAAQMKANNSTRRKSKRIRWKWICIAHYIAEHKEKEALTLGSVAKKVETHLTPNGAIRFLTSLVGGPSAVSMCIQLRWTMGCVANAVEKNLLFVQVFRGMTDFVQLVVFPTCKSTTRTFTDLELASTTH